MSVLIFVELDNGTIKKSSLEAIYYGAKVAESTQTSATVLAIGPANADALQLAGRYGAKKVLHAADEKLTHENSLAYADVLTQAVEREGSKIVIMAKTGLGDAVAARAAAKLKAAIVSGVTELPDTSSGFTVTRAIYTGKAFATVELNSDIKMLVVRKNAVEAAEADGVASVEAFSPPCAMPILWPLSRMWRRPARNCRLPTLTSSYRADAG